VSRTYCTPTSRARPARTARPSPPRSAWSPSGCSRHCSSRRRCTSTGPGCGSAPRRTAAGGTGSARWPIGLRVALQGAGRDRRRRAARRCRPRRAGADLAAPARHAAGAVAAGARRPPRAAPAPAAHGAYTACAQALADAVAAVGLAFVQPSQRAQVPHDGTASERRPAIRLLRKSPMRSCAWERQPPVVVPCGGHLRRDERRGPGAPPAAAQRSGSSPRPRQELRARRPGSRSGAMPVN
jgi:hypothetical protein